MAEPLVGGVGGRKGTPLPPEEKPDANEHNTMLWEKLVFIVTALCVSVVGELYYGLSVPFLPAEAAERGVNPDLVGVMISAYALGMLAVLGFAANLLRVFSPFQLLNMSILVQACSALSQGAIQPLRGWSFFALVTVSRMILGAACGISETVRVAVVLRLVSKEHVSTVMALTMGVRSVSTLASPAVGGALYTVGGYTFPYLLGGCVFIALYFAQLMLMRVMSRLPSSVPQSSSIFTILKVPMVWCMVTVIIVWGFSSYLFEPLYQRVLGTDPYSLNVAEVGLYGSILPASLSITFFTVGTFLNKIIGELAQQAMGMAVSVVGFITLYFCDSTGTFATGMAIIGVGIGLTGPTNPAFVLRILEIDAGLTKREVGGALGAVLFAILMLGALLGPLLGSGLFALLGFNTLSLSVGIAFGVVYIPCFILLLRYDSTPAGGIVGECIRGTYKSQ